jgi:hypothetical protein
MKFTTPLSLPLAIGLLYTAACASGSSTAGAPAAPAGGGTMSMSATAPSPDPRVGLKPGIMAKWSKDTTKRVMVQPAAEASWNMRLVANRPPAEPFISVTHSDLAFRDHYVIQGNYDGYQVWDVTNPRAPKLFDEYVCRGSQSDVSVYKNLIFVSGESVAGRLDCGTQGVPDSVSKERFRGIRIFDATDLKHLKYIANVQTCRGSHTHTVVEDPKDKENVYVYISGSSGVRPESELAGCVDLSPDVDPRGEQFRIEVIQVPLAHPEQAKVVSKPGILQSLSVAPRNAGRNASDSTDRAAQAAARAGRGGAPGRAGGPPGGGRGPARAPSGPVQCHDITVYPAVGLAGGACGGYGLLLDINDVKNPKRIYAAADSNMSFWHSATFSNDGKKVLFSDEWGGGSAPRCRSTDKYEWGADALFTIENGKEVFHSYYKMPAAQTSMENCVAHNGSLIPIPGRDVMIQAWYQGGVSLFEWTDVNKPKEIAFFDRGPIDTVATGANGGSWSVYWYNGYMYSSEIGRGLDVFELLPSAFISQNELDAAKTVHYDYLNVQGQQKMVWPTTFSLAKAYVDQLQRSNGLTAARVTAVMGELTAAEKASGAARKNALTLLSAKLDGEAGASSDANKVRMLSATVKELAAK